MYRTDFWTLWERARVGCFKRTASKHVYYPGWNRSPAQVGCIRQVLGPGALGRPRGIGWRGRWEGGSGWGIHVKPWLILVNVWQKPLQYCKVISLQLIKKKRKVTHLRFHRSRWAESQTPRMGPQISSYTRHHSWTFPRSRFFSYTQLYRLGKEVSVSGESFIFLINLFYFWLRWVFVARHRLSLVVESGATL